MSTLAALRRRLLSEKMNKERPPRALPPSLPFFLNLRDSGIEEREFSHIALGITLAMVAALMESLNCVECPPHCPIILTAKIHQVEDW
ncbi:unnamed protein product [Rodentolepis nana]|uniref:Uncharacterized protein n=1 Tax=Rodentolepis nana TaxID=102285 RepID=A0A0R3TF93_RODNA|nr:unnamed protein product [Rodentolepis nana]